MAYQPFNLRSFEDEAQTIVAQARAKARDLLAAAMAECARIRDQAYREGFEAGKEVGLRDAETAERERIAKETAGIAGTLESIARGIEGKRAELLAAAERDLVKLAHAIAGKVVDAEVAASRPIANESIRKAIELVVNRHELEADVHPADLELLERFLPELRAQFPDLGKIELRPSDAVARGGCVVRTREGAVDAELKTQLEEIARSLGI
jgi:flagellar assembly protein FliH